jgi:hypothetical protein
MLAASAEDDDDEAEAEDEPPAATAASTSTASPEQATSPASDKEDAEQEDGGEEADEDDDGDGDGEPEEKKKDVAASLLERIEVLGDPFCDGWFLMWIREWKRGADYLLPPVFLELAAELERRRLLRRWSTPVDAPNCVGAKPPFYTKQRCGECYQCKECQGYLCGACAGCCQEDGNWGQCAVHLRFGPVDDDDSEEDVWACLCDLHVHEGLRDEDPQLVWFKNLYQLWTRGDMDQYIPPAFLSVAQEWEKQRAVSRSSTIRLCDCTGELCSDSACGNKCATCTKYIRPRELCGVCCKQRRLRYPGYSCRHHVLLEKIQEELLHRKLATESAARATETEVTTADGIDGKRAREDEAECDESVIEQKESAETEEQVSSPESKKAKRS